MEEVPQDVRRKTREILEKIYGMFKEIFRKFLRVTLIFRKFFRKF